MLQRCSRASALLLTILFLALVVPVSRAQQASDEARLREIDEYAAKALRDWRVPGMAVAIVKDDRVVFAKGYGVREAGKPAPVDEHTLFAVASNTKAFTAAALAILVDEGKVKWDDPVSKYLPSFQLFDTYATRELTLRDLLSHRSGLATFGGDLLWYETTYGRDEILRRIRFLKPTSSFRSRYGYQNVMFVAAGQVVAAVTGKSWDEFVRERFFAPLGMNSTNTSVRDFRPGANVASPHNELDGRLRVLHHGNVDGAGPAASINSSVAEMAQWIRLQLGRGTYQGKQIFSPRAAREMWLPVTVVPVSESGERFNPAQHFNTYGLGWFLSDYQGRKVVTHSGGLDGMISRVGMLPEERLGLVVLTNSETPVSTALMYKIFDTFLGAPARDWSADYLARNRQAEEAAKAEEQKVDASRVTGTRPSLALARYAGAYGGEMYGEARITEEQGRLVLRLLPSPNLVADLEHWHYDTFLVRWRDTVAYAFGRGFVTFTLNARGEPDEMKIDVPNPDFDFKELEFKRLRN